MLHEYISEIIIYISFLLYIARGHVKGLVFIKINFHAIYSYFTFIFLTSPQVEACIRYFNTLIYQMDIRPIIWLVAAVVMSHYALIEKLANAACDTTRYAHITIDIITVSH